MFRISLRIFSASTAGPPAVYIQQQRQQCLEYRQPCAREAAHSYSVKTVRSRTSSSATMETTSSKGNLGCSTFMKMPDASNNSHSVCRFYFCRAVALSCLIVPLLLTGDDYRPLYPEVLPCKGILFPSLSRTVSDGSTEPVDTETATPTDIERFVSKYRLIKEHLPHYYAGFTPEGDLLYFIELNNLDSSIVERHLVTIRDLEMHLQLVRQIVWDCLISLDVQPRMHIFADLRGLNAGSLGAFWSTRFTVLRHILRSLRDKTLTKRKHHVSVAVVSDSPFVRALVEIKKHKFPPNSNVRVYNSLSEMFKYHEQGVWTPSVLPRRYGGTADTQLEKDGFEFLIKMFVEQILRRNKNAIEQCAAVGARARSKELQSVGNGSSHNKVRRLD